MGLLEVSTVKSYLLVCQIKKWRSIQIKQLACNDVVLEPELEPKTSDTYLFDHDLFLYFEEILKSRQEQIDVFRVHDCHTRVLYIYLT